MIELLIRAFNWLYFETFGYEEHLKAKFALETAVAHRLNVALYADASGAIDSTRGRLESLGGGVR